MNRAWLGVSLMGAAMSAHALGGVADVEIINRDTGEVLKVYRHQGEYWVAGQPGARYAISVHNRLGNRVLAVMAVDGVNVISGKTAAWDQGGYVFNGGEEYSVYGWRKSNQEVADFNFTALPDSYAARTGRPENVGVIGSALFCEKRPIPRLSEDYRLPPGVVGGSQKNAPTVGAQLAEQIGRASCRERV